MKLWSLTVALSLCASLAAAEVRLETRADGSTLLHNDGSRRARHRVLRPVAPPRELDRLIDAQAERQRLDPKLVRAVIQVESAFRPDALSHKGAMGLMQLMPGTARELAVADPWDPQQNLAGGTAYLRRMLDRFDGRLELALAGYNAGPRAVERYDGIPPYAETEDYVEKVLRLYRGDPAWSVAASARGRGRPTFLTRDGSGRLLLTTSPRTGR